jgi:transposase InsO family protein
LVRCRLNRLTHIDRATAEPIRRYEHQHPGDLLHVDVKKLGRVPDGGGWRYVGRKQGSRNKATTPDLQRSKWHNALTGTCYLHTVIDDHSRVAYVEAHDDETKETATMVLRNAVAWFADRGVVVQRVLSDNGSCYRSNLWRQTCADLAITAKKTKPYRPQTNGKSRGSTAPWPTAGHSRSSTTPNQPASRLCQHGSTSTTTTGPTRPSGSAHPSPG